jgi:hypothetical protein
MMAAPFIATALRIPFTEQLADKRAETGLDRMRSGHQEKGAAAAMGTGDTPCKFAQVARRQHGGERVHELAKGGAGLKRNQRA